MLNRSTIPFAPLYSITTLAFPNPISGMSCLVFTPENQIPQNSPPPINGAGKSKRAFAHAFVLAAGSSHSFIRSIRTSFHYFIRSPHQLQHPTCKCFVPHTHYLPTHCNTNLNYFYQIKICIKQIITSLMNELSFINDI